MSDTKCEVVESPYPPREGFTPPSEEDIKRDTQTGDDNDES